ncbi:MAG: zinc-ribbon domain-containing protein [Clostridia bacterium]|nr:zinc-ribbon domain-containing protein [Clostridia bacterium]
MSICSKCGNQCPDQAVFCNVCGTPLAAPQGAPVNNTYQAPPQETPVYQAPPQQQYQPAAPAYDPYDHTADFDAKDISDNKVIAMAPYLLGWVGIIVALLAAAESKYAGFHMRQALKFSILNVLVTICTVVLCWTIIVPIAAGVLNIALFVIKIICFFDVCKGKAKDAAIIRSIPFFK